MQVIREHRQLSRPGGRCSSTKPLSRSRWARGDHPIRELGVGAGDRIEILKGPAPKVTTATRSCGAGSASASCHLLGSSASVVRVYVVPSLLDDQRDVGGQHEIAASDCSATFGSLSRSSMGAAEFRVLRAALRDSCAGRFVAERVRYPRHGAPLAARPGRSRAGPRDCGPPCDAIMLPQIRCRWQRPTLRPRCRVPVLTSGLRSRAADEEPSSRHVGTR